MSDDSKTTGIYALLAIAVAVVIIIILFWQLAIRTAERDAVIKACQEQSKNG